MALDNSKLIAPFAPKKDDGDSFVFTELLDRSRNKGNNGERRFKTYFHRSVDEFWKQWPDIQKTCDLIKIRAYTRVQRRSFAKVGKDFAKAVLEAALSNNYAGMKSLYQHVCATTPPVDKMWLFDVDAINDKTVEFGCRLVNGGHMLVNMPSKTGTHYIVKPFDKREIQKWMTELNITTQEMSLHLDNPTNLYIPDGAD